ncbi:MAG: PAS domain S-box protein [Phycisphaerae bacterium]|nr:PAS domain S-box protein [Phycisphaerae bacterium]
MLFRNSGKNLLSFQVTILVLIITYVFSIKAEGTSPVREKNVLIIHSYHHGLAWTSGQDEGIIETLSSQPNIETYTEFLDTKRIALEQISDYFAEFIAQKYGTTKFDAVMVTDNNALTFVSDYYNRLFKGSPVVFSGINNFQPDMLNKFNGQASGVVEDFDPKGTYDLISKLQGEITQLVVVSGTTVTAQAICKEVERELTEISESQEIVWLDRLDTDDLLERLGKLSDKDAVLLCNFNRDAQGRYYSHEKSGRMISKASNAPVYAMEDHYLGTGVIGGFMTSSKDQGLIAGKICLDILKGGKIPDIVTTSPNVIMFDYKAMSRFGLDISKLPDSAVIINKPVSFYEQNKTLIWNTVIVFCMLVAALLSVSFWLMRARRAEKQLRCSQERLNLVMSVNNDGILDWNYITGEIYFNDRYYTMAGYEPGAFPSTYDEWAKRLHPEEIVKVEQALNAYIAGETSKYDQEYRFKSKDNEWMWIRARLKIVERDSTGTPLRIVGTHTDITERKQAEYEIKKSRNFLQEVIDGIPDEIIVIDSDYQILLANRAAQKKNETGLLVESMTCYQMMHGRDRPCDKNGHACPLHMVIESKKPFTTTHTHYNAAGDRTVEEISASPIFNDAGEIIYIVESCRDITERMRFEDALSESEKKYRTLFEQSADATLIIEGNKFIDCNQATVEMLGYPNEEDLLNTHPSDLSPEYQPDGKSSFEKADEMMSIAFERGSHRFEWNHKRCNGEIFPVEVLLTAIELADRKFLYVVWRDITDRKWDENRLLAERIFTDTIVQSMPGLFYIFEKYSARFVRRNDNWSKVSSYSEYELDKMTALDFFEEGPERDLCADRMQEVYDSGSSSMENLFVTKLGKKIPYYFTGKSLVIDGQAYLVGLGLDITDRKRAEQQRERNRYYLQRAQEIGHLGTWEMDIIKNELVWTDENYRIFGIEPGTELTYESFLECIYPDDRKYLEEQWKRSVANREPYDIEHRIVVDNQVKWVREKAELEYDDKGKCIRGTGFTQDITDRKQAEKQQEELVKSLEYKNKELQDIVYTASHDLRSPLVNIQGFSGELEKEYNRLFEILTEQSESIDKAKQIEPVIKEYIPECLKFINSGAKKMASLLDGLLQVSRIGTVEIKSEVLDIDRIVREILDAMEHQKKVSNIKVTVDSLPKCIGDSHMMDHVFTNLISNAIKYRDTAKESIIKISGRVDGDMSIYCVEDNGIGIAPNHQKKIFEIFHRLDPESSVTGEGLGLTIVTRIMDRLGGKIWLKSKPGKGSKFYIALPAFL